MSDGVEVAVDVVDARDALGIVVFTETPEGGVRVDLKGMKVDTLTAARLCYRLAKALKAKHDAETTQEEAA